MVEEHFEIDGMVRAYMLGLDIEVEVWQDQPLVVVSRKNLDDFSSRGYKCSNMDRFLVCELVGLAEPVRAQTQEIGVRLGIH